MMIPPLGSTPPSLVRHVPHVVAVGSGEQVFRIHASGVVAFVENVPPLGYGADKEFITDPVGVLGFVTTNPQSSVAPNFREL